MLTSWITVLVSVAVGIYLLYEAITKKVLYITRPQMLAGVGFVILAVSYFSILILWNSPEVQRWVHDLLLVCSIIIIFSSIYKPHPK